MQFYCIPRGYLATKTQSYNLYVNHDCIYYLLLLDTIEYEYSTGRAVPMAFVSRVRLHVARDALKAAWKPGYSYMKAASCCWIYVRRRGGRATSGRRRIAGGRYR